MNEGLPRPIRAILGVVALMVLLIVMNGWLQEYRGARAGDDRAGSVEATVTPEGAGGTQEGEGQTPEPPAAEGERTVVVIIDGLNFRREPASDAELIDGLRRNDSLTYLGTLDGWYHVRHPSGAEGYVSANPLYTELRD